MAAKLPGLTNRNVICRGKTVIRDDHNLPILDEDGQRQYRPCRNWAANGTDLCGKHGGALAPTVAAARRRLLYGAEDIVEILDRLARDETIAPADRIKAINSYLDRAGIRSGVEVEVDTPGWRKVLGQMFGVPEEEQRAGDALAPNDEEEETTEAPPAPVKRAPATKATAKARPAKAPATSARKKAAPRARVEPSSGKPKFEGWE